MYLSSRNNRVKQSNNVKGLGSSQLLHGCLLFVRIKMLVFITYIVKLNISIDLTTKINEII